MLGDWNLRCSSGAVRQLSSNTYVGWSLLGMTRLDVKSHPEFPEYLSRDRSFVSVRDCFAHGTTCVRENERSIQGKRNDVFVPELSLSATAVNARSDRRIFHLRNVDREAAQRQPSAARGTSVGCMALLGISRL